MSRTTTMTVRLKGLLSDFVSDNVGEHGARVFLSASDCGRRRQAQQSLIARSKSVYKRRHLTALMKYTVIRATVGALRRRIAT